MTMPLPPSPPPEHTGRRLGEFILGEKIGEGSFGAIYLAEQIGLPRQVVVKILRARYAADPVTARHSTYLAYVFYGHPNLLMSRT